MTGQPQDSPTSSGPARRPRIAGMIEYRGVLGDAVAEMGQRIVAGEWQPGEAIPREPDLCAELGISRSIIREAMRVLGAKGLVRSRTSDGTRVTPHSEWRQLDPDVMDWRIRAGDTHSLLRDLLTVRLVMEPGIVRTATLLADDAARERVAATWAEKVAVYTTPDPDEAERRNRFIETDLAFHRAFLEATGSQLLEQLFSVIKTALRLLIDMQMRARGYETEMIGMEESHELHEAVFHAFIARDADAAQTAMQRVIEAATADAHDGMAAQLPTNG